MNNIALYSRFLNGLKKSPDRVALRAGGAAVRYTQLHELALRCAGQLARDGGPVGVLTDRGPDAAVCILAALYAGRPVVPLHPAFPESRTRHMIEAAGVTTVLPSDLAGKALREPVEVSADDTAYVLFTSGSTGRPKAVPITHGNLAHYFGVLDDRYDFTPDDVFSQTFDLTFDCAMFDLFCAWGAGAAVTVVPPLAYRNLPRFVAENDLTVWFSTPSAITAVRRAGSLTPNAFPGLRWSFFAGEALRCTDAEAWQAAAPSSHVENIYGPTELTITITGHRWDPAVSPALSPNGVVPIGPVHPGHDYVLLDGSSADEGELCVTGPQTTPGYLLAEDDRGRFVEIDGRRWYRTGDRVRHTPSDDLLYLGRLDDQVQVGGQRVELSEVDNALRSCDGVDDAATVAVVTDGRTDLVAFHSGRPVSAADLTARLRNVLPPGVLPRRFHHLDELPLNANRKVDRKALRAMAGGDPNSSSTDEPAASDRLGSA